MTHKPEDTTNKETGRTWTAKETAALVTINKLVPLGDAVYDVREEEGKGWDGPNVVAYSDACEVIDQWLKANGLSDG